MTAVRLHPRVRDEMLAHARAEAPNECCGLLIGDGAVIDGSVRARNLDPEPSRRYLLDPAVHVSTSRRLRGTGREVVGCYHSHPYSAAAPSPSDVAEALYPDFVWIIVSLAAPQAEAIAAYRLADAAFTPIAILPPAVQMSTVLESIRSEFARYKKLAEGAISQLPDEALSAPGPNDGNSIATVCWHVSGNLHSRFTDFLTSDGEKPWRNREEEFDRRTVSRAELLTKWDQGWATLYASIDALRDEDLSGSVIIRRESLSVHEALHRSLAHTAYHVGQIVYLAKAFRGQDWTSLSIPRGGSEAWRTAGVEPGGAAKA